MLDHAVGLGGGIRNRFERRSTGYALLTQSQPLDVLSGDRVQQLSSKRPEYLNRNLIAYLSLHPPENVPLNASDLHAGLSLFRENVEELSTCKDGSIPYAKMSLPSGDVFLAVKANGAPGCIDLEIFDRTRGLSTVI